MDFGSLLNVAQKNSASRSNEVRCYKTKFEPPKKEERNKRLSNNIKKFLERKEAEERQKAREAKLKREELLALRSKDKKAQRRVQVMLKRTKSANQSVLEDAVDSNNTAVTLVGPSQPDEDDYGYVSQEASAFYNKMMAKYNSMPEEPKFPTHKRTVDTNLSNTKDRVKAALLKEQEDALLPHKRKRRKKDDQAEEAGEENVYEEERNEAVTEKSEKLAKPKPKNAPPPMNFAELLKIAAQKQFEPIKIEPKKEEEEPPLTKKQKLEQEREKAARERREQMERVKSNEKPGLSRIPKTNSSSNDRIPKVNSNSNERTPKVISSSNERPPKVGPSNSERIPKINSSNNERTSKTSVVEDNRQVKSLVSNKPPIMSINNSGTKSLSKKTETEKIPDKIQSVNRSSYISSNEVSKTYKDNRKPASKIEAVRNSLSEKPKPSSDIQKTKYKDLFANKPGSASLHLQGDRTKQVLSKDKIKQIPNDRTKQTLVTTQTYTPSLTNGVSKQVTSEKLKQLPENDRIRSLSHDKLHQSGTNDKSRQLPVKPKQFPPPGVRGRQFPPSNVKQKSLTVQKGRIIDDDEEYDSEMDDFIDDGPLDEEDYSKHIREIFGYDRSRYRNVDDDDVMESTFSQQMKEEFISTKIGIMEDLEDIRQENEDKKRKMVMMKKTKK